MSAHDKGKTSFPWMQMNIDEWMWFLAVPVIGTFNVVFEGGNLPEVGLTLLCGSILGSVIGLRYTWSNRHPLEHEQSHIKLTILTSIVLWTVFVIGGGLVGWVGGIIDRGFWSSLVFLITAGYFLPVLVGAIWGMGIRVMDWYPLRRTRASVIRLIVLYLIALSMMSISSALMFGISKWQWYLVMTGDVLIWLGVARLWRG